MSKIEEMLLNYATESGEIPVEEMVISSASEVIAENHPVPGDTLPDTLAHADKAREIAEHLDDLAERAEELAKEDETYANKVISTESLHREYLTIMRAYKLYLPAESFESAGSDERRLKGLIQDAKKGSRLLNGLADSIEDFSSEGKIIQFLRRDKAKLADAKAALLSAKKALEAKAADVKEAPVAIQHRAIAKFLMVDDKPTKDFVGDFNHDVKWLEDVSKYISETYSALLDSAKSGEEPKYPKSPAPQHYLLMNGYVETKSYEDSVEDIKVTYKTPTPKNLGMAIFMGLLEFSSWTVLGGMAAGVAGAALGPVGFIAASGATKALATARAVGSGDRVAYEHLRKAKSQAGFSDIEKVISSALTLEKMLDFKLDDDAFETALKSVEGDLRKKLKGSFADLVKMVDVVYEHAYQLTIHTALIAEQVAKHSGRSK